MVRTPGPHLSLYSFGQSAGSFSVAQHMLANGGDPEGLFRAAFMLSGNAPPTGDVDSPYMQETFDGVVERAGCQGQSDPLDCLRSVPLENIVNAMADAPTLFGFAVRMSFLGAHSQA